jgi:heme exporter protein B
MTHRAKMAWLLLRKDLRIELRTREVLYTGTLFTIVLVTLFLFSGFESQAMARAAAPGVLWVSLAFTGTLVFSRTFQREKDERAIAGVVLVPGAIGPLFASKLGANLVLLGLITLLLVPAVLFPFRVEVIAWGPFIASLILGLVGFASLGTVLAAALASLRLREVLLPIVLYPLCIPLLLAGVQVTASAFGTGAVTGGWLQLMLVFDVLFLIVSRWLFGESVDHGEGL